MTPISDMDKIGRLVRQRRRELGIDQATVASLAGVSRKVVSEIERGKPTIRFDVLSKVLETLGLRLGVS